MDNVYVYQGISLLLCIAYHGLGLLLSLPAALLQAYRFPAPAQLPPNKPSTPDSEVIFYEGYVNHSRTLPKKNSFRYEVRTALINLDNPPSWFSSSKQASDHMTAAAARSMAGTTGRVRLLTGPETAGYVQNPISVYYCYDESGVLKRCIAEVTNTPWGERVTFAFNPAGEHVKKALHVSPFMDMENTWHLTAPEPGDTLRLAVFATHPKLGAYFHAEMLTVRSSMPALRSEEGGLKMLLRYGYQPHRVAILIYWQAVILLYKGVALHTPPAKSFQGACTAARNTHPPDAVTGKWFVWRNALGWPWDATPQ